MKTATLTYLKNVLIMSSFALILSACGKKGDDAQPVAGSICPPGTSYEANGLCFDQFNNPINSVGGYGLGYISMNFQTQTSGSTMQITNGGNYRNFLREALGVCDRGGMNGGIYSCNAWLAGYAQMVLQAPASTGVTSANLTFWAYPRTANNYWYGYQMPSVNNFLKGLVGLPVISNIGAYRNPMNIGLTISVVNQDRGFEGRAYGPYDSQANVGLIQISVAQGKLLDNVFNYTLFYKGQEFARGTMYRCLNSNCQ